MTNDASSFEDRLLPVGNHQLHIRRGGAVTALPTIVLEAGGGSIMSSWNALEQALAPHARVLAYERAGIGDSSGPVDSVGAEATARRLAAVLSATHTPTPVILVGHSLGGLHARYFAATRPELVAGLVLLDATPVDLPFPRFYSVKPTLVMWMLYGIARIGLLKRLAGRGKLPPSLIAAIGRFRHIKTVLTEIGALRSIQAEVGAHALPDDLPVLALSAGAKALEPQAQRDHFHVSHERIAAAARAPHSRHQRIIGATHMSMLTDAQHAASVAALIIEFAQGTALSS
jgi:pimeloyl-ACP methyl ester carboxylesterase